jgi:galactose mutarotase-like enzyme
MEITLEERKIRWDWSTTNKGRLDDRMYNDMPSTDALHPYIQIGQENKERIKTNIVDFDPETHDWSNPNDQIKDMPSEGMQIEIPGKGTVTIKVSEQFRKVILWTEEGKPHICFEPWVGGLYAILNKEQRITIPEDETENFWVEISFEPEDIN